MTMEDLYICINRPSGEGETTQLDASIKARWKRPKNHWLIRVLKRLDYASITCANKFSAFSFVDRFCSSLPSRLKRLGERVRYVVISFCFGSRAEKSMHIYERTR